MSNLAEKLSPTEIWMAYDHIEGLHGKTPLIYFGLIHQDGFEVDVWAKMDILNPGGSFKDRGAEYFIFKAIKSGLTKKGDTIVTASAGNHAKGVAKAAREYGLKAVIYMSDKTPQKKLHDTEELGGIIEKVEGDYHKAAEEAMRFAGENNSLYVPAYEHEHIITGQSTVVTETMIQLAEFGIRPDFFVYPVGGGGLANGGGFAANHFDSAWYFLFPDYGRKLHNFGVQAHNFNTMFRSFHAGTVLPHEERGDTIADGIKVRNASEEMLRLSLTYLDDMFDVTEEQIRNAIRRVYNSELIRRLQELPQEELIKKYGFSSNHANGISRMNVVEGAAASAFACAFAEDKIPYEKIAKNIHPRKNIVGVVVASGNNIDQKLLEDILAEEKN